MNLKDYLQKNGLSQRAFAMKINMSRTTLSNFLQKKQRLGRIIAKRIYEETKGKVSLKELLLGIDDDMVQPRRKKTTTRP